VAIKHTCPFAAPSRRSTLFGLAGAGAALVAGAARAATGPAAEAAVPFFGAHQPGVATPVQACGMVVAFDMLGSTRAELRRLLRTLTARVAFLMQGGPVPPRDPKLPPADSGLLGPLVQPDGLSITVALGASLFDARFGLAALRPRHLARMPRFPNDQLDPTLCHGDLMLQICANSNEAVLHALRDIVKNTPDLMAPRWKLEGFLPAGALAAGTTPRNLMGFKDGTANLQCSDAVAMDRHVWVQKGQAGEPAWTEGGSYQVVRVIRMLVERWDRTPLREQETIFGRDKAEGAPLGMTGEKAIPDYAGDPDGEAIPLDAHIRLANPRTPATESSLILRRPFSYSRGLTRAGQMDMGLLFICYQSDLAAGFATVQQRLNGEPLEEYIKPIGGGYFFVLPGVQSADGWLGDRLLNTAGS
jgi:deferrochelatase/peroxidase EfeB